MLGFWMKSQIEASELEPRITRQSATTWIIELEEDPETGDVVMPLPAEALEANGWQVGDELTWGIDERTRQVTLTKKAP
jgi:hypothetical protein